MQNYRCPMAIRWGRCMQQARRIPTHKTTPNSYGLSVFRATRPALREPQIQIAPPPRRRRSSAHQPAHFRMRSRATVALSTALALCFLISAPTLLFVQSAFDDQSHCTTANDCTEEDKHAKEHATGTLPPHHHHRETMSNADKFIELANGEFPEGALPDQLEYEHPLVKRYATKEMSFVWSPAMKFTTWRKLWTALATAEQELGIEISDEQLEEMRSKLYDVDFEYAAEKEKEFRHDVMGHVHAYGKAAPSAMPIIHLGATSCYVGDNTDIVQIRDALKLIKRKLVKTISILREFAAKYRDLPTLGFTHYQPAQLTTVGKRCTLWMQDLMLDLERVEREIEDLPMRGVKGTTGTQASFLELFDGDHEKVKALNKRVCELMGFKKAIPVSGQTYTRKIDFNVLSVLSGVAQSAYKMCGDIRLLANLKEVEEPFAKTQIGSSAMAYKRNPMRSERVCSIARYVMGLPNGAANTHANQWFERTLDDSAIRRIYLPEGFLAVDVILTLLANIADGLHVWPNVVKAHAMAELPFMATEVILMECVKAGGDRQELHEAIRVHSMDAGKVVKGEGKPNDLMERIAKDPLFKAVHDKLDAMIDPILFVGRAPEQVDEFLADEIDPVLKANSDLLEIDSVDAVNV